MRLREVKTLAQDHIATKCLSENVNPGLTLPNVPHCLKPQQSNREKYNLSPENFYKASEHRYLNGQKSPSKVIN